MPFHHAAISVQDMEVCNKFYLAALKPLGYELKMSFADGHVVGLGFNNAPADFWYNSSSIDKPATTGMHIAFNAANREQVRQFYEAALSAGGKDNGPPGVRAHYSWYSGEYYAAFVLDPEGRNIEVVCIGHEDA